MKSGYRLVGYSKRKSRGSVSRDKGHEQGRCRRFGVTVPARSVLRVSATNHISGSTTQAPRVPYALTQPPGCRGASCALKASRIPRTNTAWGATAPWFSLKLDFWTVRGAPPGLQQIGLLTEGWSLRLFIFVQTDFVNRIFPNGA